MTDRSIQELRSEIAALWRTYEAAGRGKRYSDWTEEDKQSYGLKTVVEGMSYGFTGLRLSQAGEAVLRSTPDLHDLAVLILARMEAKGDPIAIGFVTDQINQLGREHHSNTAA